MLLIRIKCIVKLAIVLGIEGSGMVLKVECSACVSDKETEIPTYA